MTLSELRNKLKQIQDANGDSGTSLAAKIGINFQSLLKLYNGKLKTESGANYKAMVQYVHNYFTQPQSKDIVVEKKREGHKPFSHLKCEKNSSDLGTEFIKKMIESPDEIATQQEEIVDTSYTYQGTRLVNLLDHFVHFLTLNHDGTYRIISLKPSTKPIRTLYHREFDKQIKTSVGVIQINKGTVKTVIGLPDKQQDVLYIVNKVTCFEHPTREDLVIPDECLEMGGKIICTSSFMVNPYLYHLKEKYDTTYNER